MVDVSQMSTYITILCEAFLANITLEGPGTGMSAEMVDQVTTFFEKGATAQSQTALIELLVASCDRVCDLYYLVPVGRDLIECVRFLLELFSHQVFSLA
jgi:hypothetical protein